MIYITKESEFVKRSDNGLVYYLTKAINTDGELLIVLDAPLISDYSINAKSITAVCIAYYSDGYDAGIESNCNISAKNNIYVIGHLMTHKNIKCNGDITTTSFIDAATIQAKGKLSCWMIGTYNEGGVVVESVKCGDIACDGRIKCVELEVNGRRVDKEKPL